MPRLSVMTYLNKGPWPSACLDIVTRPSAYLDTVPQLSAMTCPSKVPRPSACLDTVPRHNAMICLGMAPRPSACLGTVPRPSAMPSHGAST